MGCTLTKICNVSKNGESDGKIQWRVLLGEYDSSEKYCYKISKIDSCDDTNNNDTFEINYEDVYEENGLPYIDICAVNLSAGVYNLQLFRKNEDLNLLDFLYTLIYTYCNTSVREPDKLQMILTNNKKISCCKSKSDLTIFGGVIPYQVFCNDVDISNNYSSVCIQKCKKNKIKVIDANNCMITKCF